MSKSKKSLSTIICLFIISSYLSVGLFSQQLSATQQPTSDAPIIDDSSLTSAVEAGSYPVHLTYTSENGTVSTTTIYVTLYYQRTVSNLEIGEAIDAHDIEINENYFTKLSDGDLINLTKARAWLTQNNLPLDIVTVTRTTIDKSTGVYNVTFTTPNGTSTTVNVIERTESYMQVNEKYFSYDTGYYQTVFTFISLTPLAILVIAFLLNTSNTLKEVREVEEVLYHKSTTNKPTE